MVEGRARVEPSLARRRASRGGTALQVGAALLAALRYERESASLLGGAFVEYLRRARAEKIEPIGESSRLRSLPTWGATVRGTYPTPEAGTRTQYVLYVGPWGQAALRFRYVHNAGGWYA